MVEGTGRGSAPSAGGAGGFSRLRPWFAGPPGWVLGLLGAGNLLLTGYACIAPGGYFTIALWALLIWFGLTAALLVKAVAAAVVAAVAGQGGGAPAPDAPRLRPGRLWRWALLPVLFASTVALSFSGVPIRAGAFLAEPAVAAYAADPQAPEPERFGPYPVLRAEHLDGGGARFLIEGAGLINLRGFAYTPGYTPPRLGEDTYTRLGGPWYVWTMRF